MKGRKDLVASAAYLPEPAAVAAARKFVRDTLRSWLDTAPGAEADGGLVDDAVLLTSELVTNAVVHAGTQVQVTCKLAAGAVEVVVRDSHPARMVPGPAPDDTVPAERTGGRGLLLPSALAAAWGVSYGTDAKAVWFRMGSALGTLRATRTYSRGRCGAQRDVQTYRSGWPDLYHRRDRGGVGEALHHGCACSKGSCPRCWRSSCGGCRCSE